MIGIIGALDTEVNTLISMLDNPVTLDMYGSRFVSGKLCGKDVVIAKCGVGKVAAAVCTQNMIVRFAPELIINTGVAGSLSAGLDICDIVVGSDVVQHDFDTSAFGNEKGAYFPCDEHAANAIIKSAQRQNLHAISARIATGDQFIWEDAKKKWLASTFGAVACEMEGGAIAQTCQISGVKCAIIRAISDATTGKHDIEFTEFVHIAADNSAKVLLGMLETDEL